MPKKRVFAPIFNLRLESVEFSDISNRVVKCLLGAQTHPPILLHRAALLYSLISKRWLVQSSAW